LNFNASGSSKVFNISHSPFHSVKNTIS